MSLGNWLPVSLIILSILAVFAALRAYSWRKSSSYYEDLWKKGAEAHGQINSQLVEVTSNYRSLQNQSAGWQSFWASVAEYLQKGGAVLALTTVRSQSVYTPSSGGELELCQGSKENMFVPIPALPSRKNDMDSIGSEQAIVLTDNAYDKDGHSFYIVVLVPNNEAIEAALEQSRTPVTIARIGVTICGDGSLSSPKQYKIDVEPLAGISRGANSLAMNWLLKRAEKEGVKEIYGYLTHSIVYEDHRARLYNFYIRKYEFVYTPFRQ